MGSNWSTRRQISQIQLEEPFTSLGSQQRSERWLVVGDWGIIKKVDGGSDSSAAPSKTGELGQELIKHFESCKLTAYKLPGEEFFTIGFGHYGPDVYEGQQITQAVANQLLRDDLDRFEKGICDQINVPLNQDQFDALVSWSFNCGLGATNDSTLRRRLNAGEDVNKVISEELPRWTSGGMPGLVRRREAEVKLATTGIFP